MPKLVGLWDFVTDVTVRLDRIDPFSTFGLRMCMVSAGEL
jgi:hypothetical protein